MLQNSGADPHENTERDVRENTASVGQAYFLVKKMDTK